MNCLSKVSDQWIPLQNKVFTRWVSSHISNVDKNEITDITKDLSNGVALIELAEILTNKKAPQNWSHNPNYAVEKITNCDIALDMFEKDGVQLVGISGKDISDNNEKLILGLIWSLILHYSIGQSMNNSTHYEVDMSEDRKDNNSIEINHTKLMDETIRAAEKMALLSWAEKRIRNYPRIDKFVPYDLVICALLDSYFPEKIQYKNLDPDSHEENFKVANSIMADLKIPIFVYPDDLSKSDNKVDMKTLLTQLSAAKVVLDNVTTNCNINSYEEEHSDLSQKSESEVRANIELAKIEKVEIDRKERIQNAEKMEKVQKIEVQKMKNNQSLRSKNTKVKNASNAPSSKLIVESYPEEKKNVIIKESHDDDTKKTINIGIGIKKKQAIKNIKQIGETKIVNGRRIKTIRVGIRIKAKQPGQLNLADYPQISIAPLPGDEYRHIQIKNIKVTAKHNGKVMTYNSENSPITILTN